MTIETKMAFAATLEAKADDSGLFTGYASTFGNMDRGYDTIMQGAFAKSLMAGRKPKMLWQHEWDQPIGLYKSCMEDEKGLLVEGEINLKTQKGKEAYELLKQGALDAMSIGFRVKDSDITEGGVRMIKEAELWEISLVTFPMNEQALVTGVKSINELTIREVEHEIKKHFNLSAKQAKIVVSHGFKAVMNDPLRDAGDDADQRDADEAKEIINQLSSSLKGFLNGINGIKENR